MVVAAFVVVSGCMLASNGRRVRLGVFFAVFGLLMVGGLVLKGGAA